MSFALPTKSLSRLLACVLAAMTATSCATGDRAGAGAGGSGGSGGAGASAKERAAAVLSGGDSGLLIRQWRIADDSEAVTQALMRYARGDGGDPSQRQQLERNGFRVVRVAADDADALLEELGGSSIDVDGWHGQAYDWRALAAKSVGPSGRAVAVDGRVRRFTGGRLRLMMRGWTTQMEDGPFVYLEIRPDFDQSRRSRLTHVLARPRFIGERFDSMGLDLMLEAGYAYVLTTAAPDEDWSAPVVPFGTGELPEPYASAPARAPGPGPIAEATPTVGEVLLRTDAIPPRRDLLVFVPKIPAVLFPARRQARAAPEASR